MDTIKSGKMTILEIFKDNWFNIPDYQRQYSWNEELVETLLDDIKEAMNYADREYFLGSFVYTYKNNKEEWELLDGQQRITTTFLIIACLRDIYGLQIPDIASTLPSLVYQTENKLMNKPARSKIEYKIRNDSDKFIKDYISEPSGTNNIKQNLISIYKEVGVKNMIKNILTIRNYLENKDLIFIQKFVWFLLNKTVLVYISSQSLEDAFRMFTVLNSSGLKLRNSDIIKAQNLGTIKDPKERENIAKKWELMENTLNEKEDDDAIDRLLSIIRTIIVKQKARTNLLDQFEKFVYPKYQHKELLDLIFDYYSIYSSIFYEFNLSNQATNLITTMDNGFMSTDWISPILVYYKKFQEDGNFIKFLEKLDNKFSVDWISGLCDATRRIERMNDVIEVIEKSHNSQDIINSNVFQNSQEALNSFIRNINEFDLYGRRHCYYILSKLNYINSSNSTKIINPILSIEHILPQNPERSSEWMASFNDEQREKLTNKLGNLMLINGKKNSKLGRKQFKEKKDIYFKSSIDAIPYNGFINEYNNWNTTELEENHQKQIDVVKGWYFE